MGGRLETEFLLAAPVECSFPMISGTGGLKTLLYKRLDSNIGDMRLTDWFKPSKKENDLYKQGGTI